MSAKPKWNELPCVNCGKPMKANSYTCPHCQKVYMHDQVIARKAENESSQRFAFVPVLALLLLVGTCSLLKSKDSTEPSIEESIALQAEIDKFDSPKLEPTKEGFAISSPSDLGASYRVLKISKLANGNLEVLNRRDGPSGTSFARREVNCLAYTYRYLGEGDTRIEAEADSPNPRNMSALTGTSASSDVANAACKKGTQ